MTTCWVIAATAPEVDLEDEIGAISRPLFAREEEQEGTLEAMNWEVDEDDEGSDDGAAPAPKPSRRRRKGRRRADQADQDASQRSEERRVGKECRARSAPDAGQAQQREH